MPCERCEPLLKKSFPFWEKLSEKDKLDLMNGAGCAEFKKGQNIHNGTVCTGIPTDIFFRHFRIIFCCYT